MQLFVYTFQYVPLYNQYFQEIFWEWHNFKIKIEVCKLMNFPVIKLNMKSFQS
jgi:hypothetical protein